MNRIRLNSEILQAKRILIKPNLGYPKKHPVVTRMELIAEVVDELLNSGNAESIVIMEGVCTSASFPEVMIKTGAAHYFDLNSKSSRYPAISESWKGRVELSDADREELTEFINPGPVHRFDHFLAPKAIQEADVSISIAPLKKTLLNGHPLFSGTVKNLFGLLPREHYKARSPHSRGRLHRPNVHEAICDVYRTFQSFFKFGILDLECYYESTDWKPDRRNSVPVGKVICRKRLLEVDLEGIGIVNETPCEYQQLLLKGTETD